MHKWLGETSEPAPTPPIPEASAERPSGLLMTLLQGLDTSGRLPPPPRSLGLPVSSYDRPRQLRLRPPDPGK